MTERGQWPAKQVVDVRAYNKYDTSGMLHVVLLENFSLWKHIFDPSGRHHHATPWTEMSNHEPAARKSFCAVRFGNQSDFFFFSYNFLPTWKVTEKKQQQLTFHPRR